MSDLGVFIAILGFVVSFASGYYSSGRLFASGAALVVIGTCL